MEQDSLRDEVDSLASSRQIGPYRLLEVLGEGGMGVVWLADQEEPVRRQVALKVIKLGMDTREVVSRFETERQALAVMDHPNIARVFDAGATAAGRPYFVMEVVRGLPITEFCDQERLTTHERIRIFQDVCRAAQHAHQKGIIHRDLKPSNVLVSDAEGRAHPKIIDFGIARATEEADQEGTRLTRQHHQIGTPAYMSPEQILGRNLDIDTRSDIYALGVLLYELLVGVLPFPLETYSGPALMGQLGRNAPAPSTRFQNLPNAPEHAGSRMTDPRNHVRLLRGELDWIVLKAMQKDRDLRYETVNALTMELDRFLANEPVLARPPKPGYRLKKFVQRHRASTSFAALAAFLVAGFVAVQAVQADRIRKARDLAEARRVQAEGLIDFMLGDLREKLEPMGRLDVLGDVGDQAMAYFAALPETALTDNELLTRSRALYQIGEVRLNEGDMDAAVGPLRESHRLAEALWTREPDNPQRLFGLAQSHFWLGYAHWLVGDLGDAEVEFVDYLGAAETLVDMDPESLDFRMELAYAHGTLGSLRETQEDILAAIDEYRATLAVQEELVRDAPSNLDWQLELAETLNKLGVAHRKTGDYEASLGAHRRELTLKRSLTEADPRNAYYQFRLSTALDLFAEVQVLHGDLPEAAENSRTSVGLMAGLVASDSSNVEWLRAEAVGQEQLARILIRQGSLREAEQRLGLAAMGLTRLRRAGAATLDWKLDMGRVAVGMARLRLAQGNPEEALMETRRAQDLLSDSGSVAGSRLAARAEALIVMGRALQDLGRKDPAEEWLNEALKTLADRAQKPGSADLRVLQSEGLILLGREAEADSLLAPLIRRGFADPRHMTEASAKRLSPAPSR